MLDTKISQKYLKELFSYDGKNLLWKKTITRKKTGSIAGCSQNTGHRQIKIDGKIYLAHRLIWMFHYGLWPKNDIDHVNGIRNDNRIENLREATRQENCANRCLSKLNTSGIKGVYFVETRKKWHARIKIKGKTIHIGYFDKKEDAGEAYKLKSLEIHKEFSIYLSRNVNEI